MRVGWSVHESPLGPLTVITGPAGVRGVHFQRRSSRQDVAGRTELPEVSDQLDRYFAGELRAFDLDIDLRGSRLQSIVWGLLLEIPYGETTSYGELAGLVDDAAYPDGIETYERARLVGAAVGRTPTPILVPCHRVIGADGSLTGYGEGLHRKQALLDLERRGMAGSDREPVWAIRQESLL